MFYISSICATFVMFLFCIYVFYISNTSICATFVIYAITANESTTYGVMGSMTTQGMCNKAILHRVLGVLHGRPSMPN